MSRKIQSKAHPSQKMIPIFSILWFLFLILGISIVLYELWAFWQKDDWTQELVNERLGVVIPYDASNIEFTGSRSWSDHLRVSFQDAPDAINRFASHFCNGVYFSGFDPFQAWDTGTPLDGAHPINLYGYSYYSYSRGTPVSTWGNRCEALPADARYMGVLIDKSNPRQYQITIELYFHCNACRNIPATSYSPPSS